VLAVSFFMTIADLAIVNVALPTIGQKLHFSQSKRRARQCGQQRRLGALLAGDEHLKPSRLQHACPEKHADVVEDP
jgi:hypothetical protein